MSDVSDAILAAVDAWDAVNVEQTAIAHKVAHDHIATTFSQGQEDAFERTEVITPSTTNEG